MDNLGKYVYAEQKRQEGTGYMKQQTVYLKCDRSAEVQAQDVFLKDVAAVSYTHLTLPTNSRV